MAVVIDEVSPRRETRLSRGYKDLARVAGQTPADVVAWRNQERMREAARALTQLRAGVDRGLVDKTGRVELRPGRAGAAISDRLIVSDRDGRRRSLGAVLGLRSEKAPSAQPERERLFEAVNRITEAAGLRRSLATAATAVAQGQSPNAAMRTIVEPGHTAALAKAQGKVGRNLSLAGVATREPANEAEAEGRLDARRALERTLEPGNTRDMTLQELMEGRLQASAALDAAQQRGRRPTSSESYDAPAPAGRQLVDAREAIQEAQQRLEAEMEGIKQLALKAQAAAEAAMDPSSPTEARMKSMNDANQYQARIGQAWSKMQHEVAPQIEARLDSRLKSVSPETAQPIRAAFTAAIAAPPPAVARVTRNVEEARDRFDRDMEQRRMADERMRNRQAEGRGLDRAPSFRPNF